MSTDGVIGRDNAAFLLMKVWKREDKYYLQHFGLFFCVALGRMMRRDGRSGRGIVGGVLGWTPFDFLKV